MAWLKLHSYDEGKELYVNTKLISCVNESFSHKGMTTISFVGSADDFVDVKEPLEELMLRIKLSEVHI